MGAEINLGSSCPAEEVQWLILQIGGEYFSLFHSEITHVIGPHI